VAYYVVSDDVITPMASGVSAFASRADAEAFAAANAGQIMTWDEMLTGWEWHMQHSHQSGA
jgi:nitrous oxide reductase accessory protein NosL